MGRPIRGCIGVWAFLKVLVRNGIGLKVKEINLAIKNCYMRNITYL